MPEVALQHPWDKNPPGGPSAKSLMTAKCHRLRSSSMVPQRSHKQILLAFKTRRISEDNRSENMHLKKWRRCIIFTRNFISGSARGSVILSKYDVRKGIFWVLVKCVFIKAFIFFSWCL
ncbi:hypothetical protein JTE90_019859 [Oedothorax gibbosus]|uniref:Uncharacterized protein n=1 Tax=Oedothorax gibbosus TaxID=931172 RepID=A0AAV6VXP4_9ARAC|nr:hypothetical protein JTE90_019859 [Oedothorax gibbosus]